ncbi:hypothetical protein BDW67DRAFT_159981 [Aspergillus spinulosporus]
MLTPAAGIGCNDELAVSLASRGGETHATFLDTRWKGERLKNLAAALARSFLRPLISPGNTIHRQRRQPALVPLSPPAWTGRSRFLCSVRAWCEPASCQQNESQYYDDRCESKRVGFECPPIALELSSDLMCPARVLTVTENGLLCIRFYLL